ncbi:MAG: glucose/mannose-6-phosphate isomerase [Parcubacteria group bacterium Gr01-1014_18]|nr:MAG: glucose/mannose-6-phosphate isomerase [Parcubacteria group bacterium Greene0416_36]TSC81194.1 MAG: glucose/mannose-6-phosphate isomerase [Parcubacteria group bacterium Gr01-1014_18]TSC99191.1 MAG: glucose/mannose-6-phosphate isomerase [Parcubacteria group bacterium Greene1014_20]TSD07451.1 MAG: glucose/mannose-6-phosphate isomerase [Parcubacteria group bacterium Greene0714_2]
MKSSILNFPKQFEYEPKIENPKKNHPKYEHFIVSGMGGSHLAADLLSLAKPEYKLTIHSDYGIPEWIQKSDKSLLWIASSYSGNTEEVLDSLSLARAKNIDCVAIAVAGQLIEYAKQNGIPYIQMPNTGIQPRSAIGYSLRSLLRLLEEEKGLSESALLSSSLKSESLESSGENLAGILANKIPVIYSSNNNRAIAYNWKIKFNENTKIPAFYNVLPELNHNEMNGFDVVNATKILSDKFHFIFLEDSSDHPQNQKRMRVLKDLYAKRNLPVTSIALSGKNIWEKIFANLLVADWTSYHLALSYGIEPEPVPMVEEFKELIK